MKSPPIAETLRDMARDDRELGRREPVPFTPIRQIRRASERKTAKDAKDARVLDPSAPLATARVYTGERHTRDGVLALRHYKGTFYTFGQSAYTEADDAAIRAELYGFLDESRSQDQSGGLHPFRPTKTKVEHVLDALRAVANLPSARALPCWLTEQDIDPREIVPVANGQLHIPTRRLLPATAAFFGVNELPFPYDPAAPPPAAWERFLETLWPDDAESRGTLQEFMGYLLTPHTRLQKILMVVGPKRSGKGTIGRVLRRLLGESNVCGPTLAAMSEPFGLSVLVGKSAAIIADARISGRTDTAVVAERLLSISGEDAISIPRKFLPDWTGQLTTRFVILTNELPRIEDASGALSSRFLVLTLHESFYGREDHDLFERFMPELPGILNWALAGRDRLYHRRRFVQPASSEALIQEFEDLGSPIGAFIRDRCEVGRGFEVMQTAVFDAWKTWCQENGREKPGTIQSLGRNLHAAVPWLATTQPRVAGTRVRYWQGLRLRDGDDE